MPPHASLRALLLGTLGAVLACTTVSTKGALVEPTLSTACTPGFVPTNPVEYGLCQVAGATASARSSAVVRVVLASDAAGAAALDGAAVTLDARAESYVLLPQPGLTVVESGATPSARDVRGPRRRGVVSELHGSVPRCRSRRPVSAAPAVALRAANPFLVLPADDEPSWWFRDPSFWTEYLDGMALARLDYLDMHGMYNSDNTNFPSALLWFATSPTFPNARHRSGGAPREPRDAERDHRPRRRARHQGRADELHVEHERVRRRPRTRAR